MDFVLFIIAILVLAITGSETRIILVTILLGITLIVLAYVNIYWALFAIFVLVLLLILFDKTDIQNQRKKISIKLLFTLSQKKKIVLNVNKQKRKLVVIQYNLI